MRMAQSFRNCCTGTGWVSWAKVWRTRSTGVGSESGSQAEGSRTERARASPAWVKARGI